MRIFFVEMCLRNNMEKFFASLNLKSVREKENIQTKAKEILFYLQLSHKNDHINTYTKN